MPLENVPTSKSVALLPFVRHFSSTFPDAGGIVSPRSLWHSRPMCGRYRLSRRKQIIAEHFDAISDAEDWTLRLHYALPSS